VQDVMNASESRAQGTPRPWTLDPAEHQLPSAAGHGLRAQVTQGRQPAPVARLRQATPRQAVAHGTRTGLTLLPEVAAIAMEDRLQEGLTAQSQPIGEVALLRMAKDVSPLDDAGHAMVVPGFAGKLRRGKAGAFRLDPWPSHGSTPLFLQGAFARPSTRRFEPCSFPKDPSVFCLSPVIIEPDEPTRPRFETRGRRGVKLKLAVSHFQGQRHLPLVELHHAA